MVQKNKGFTLIELMIAVAIVAIIATVAYPSYREQVRSSKRADAMADLMELSQFMERIFTENGTYQPGGSNPTLPFTQSPPSGGASYNLTISASSATTYTLRAAPTGSQSGDRCGNLTINHTGLKGVSASTVALCWKSS